MKCIAERRFRLDGKLYAAGGELDLPTNQFNDLRAAGLVRAAAKSVKRPEKAETAELPTPGNVSLNDGAE